MKHILWAGSVGSNNTLHASLMAIISTAGCKCVFREPADMFPFPARVRVEAALFAEIEVAMYTHAILNSTKEHDNEHADAELMQPPGMKRKREENETEEEEMEENEDGAEPATVPTLMSVA